jgi:hypothetical protein
MPSPRAIFPVVLATAAVSALIAIAISPSRHTYAAYSDYQDVHASAQAAVWEPDPPAACGPLSNYSEIVYGTFGDDTINGTQGAANIVHLMNGGNREIIMGLDGNDDLHGGNGKDCLVGGDGNDVLHGDPGKDILLGGDGDDTLYGSNSPDLLDGGPGNDLCIGGRAPDSAVNCEQTRATAGLQNTVLQGVVAPDAPDTASSTTTVPTPTSAAGTSTAAPEPTTSTTASQTTAQTTAPASDSTQASPTVSSSAQPAPSTTIPDASGTAVAP